MNSSDIKVRLLDFDTFDDDDDGGFTIRMFGNNRKGETVSVLVEEYNPFFYLKVGDDWRPSQTKSLLEFFKSKLHMNRKDDIIQCKELRRKNYGLFDNGKKHMFLFIEFRTISTFASKKFDSLAFN